jgi:hypothetical protein
MPETQIYKLDLSAGDVTVPGFFHSSAWAGADTPISGYPEFAQLENVHRAENAGASGQHVLDAVDTADYTVTWITLAGVGNLAYGQFDCRGGGAGVPLKVRWKQFFKSSALAEADYSSPLGLAHGGTAADVPTSPGYFTSNLFLQIEMYRDTGTAFWWNIRYRKPNGVGAFNGFNFGNSNGSLTGPTDGVSDDAEHELIVTLVPGTVTGTWPGDGLQGSGSIASDGSVSLSQDGVEVHSITGIPLVINPYAATAPEHYYGKTIWHGD